MTLKIILYHNCVLLILRIYICQACNDESPFIYKGRYLQNFAIQSTDYMLIADLPNQFLCQELCRRNKGCIASEFNPFKELNCLLYNLTNIQRYIYQDVIGTSVILQLEIYCNEHSSADGQWSPWVGNGPCNVTCGGGAIQQTRSCENRACNGDHCHGDVRRTLGCSAQPCPAWGNWNPGGCAAGYTTCGCQYCQRSWRSCVNPLPSSVDATCEGEDEIWKCCINCEYDCN